MDCIQAELAMMAHVEKTIQPADARDLTQHLLSCETCREYFVGFDMALEVLEDAELSTPPVDFTQNVMAAVSKQPVHSRANESIVIRVLWGLGAIFLGIGLLFAFNPDWWNALTISQVADNMLSAIAGAGQFFVDLFEGSSHYTANFAGASIFNIALVFVFVMGALLIVLQISEKRTNS